MKTEKVTFKNSKGQKLGGFLHIPTGKGPFPAVVLVHGFGGGSQELKNIHMCKELAKAGFVALRFDFYDKPNGLSEPKIRGMTIKQQVDGTGAAIDFIETSPFVDKNRIGLTGHSLGGMTVLIYTPTDKRVKALVVQSPVSQWGVTKTLGNFAKILKKAKEGKYDKKYFEVVKSWGILKLGFAFYESGAKYKVWKTAESIKVPTLVFHGDDDEAVSDKQSRELIKHINNGKLEIIKGSDHVYEGKALSIATNLMIDWFKEYLK